MKKLINAIKKPVSNEKGALSVLGISLIAIVITLSLMVGMAYCFRMFAGGNVITQVHDAMTKIATTSVTINSEESYASKREKYTGAYTAKHLDSDLTLLTSDEVEAKLTEMLGLNPPAGKALGKYEDLGDGRYRVHYFITDVKVTITNPNIISQTDYIEAKITLHLHIPIEIGGFVGKTEVVSMKLTATATDVPKY